MRKSTLVSFCSYPRNFSSMRYGLGVLVLVFLFVQGGVSGWAQATQGSIVGTVKDANGAVIPGALVTLTNTDEGVVRTTKTNRTGDYEFLDVKAAHYSVMIEAPRFQKWELAGAVLTVRQQLRIDASLAVGSVSQSITVSGGAASAIPTDSATISGTFSKDKVISLPTNTRASFGGTSAAGIIAALPGVQADDSGYSLQGALPYQMEVTVDGISVNGAANGLQGNSFPSSESIDNIRADGVLANAEYSDPAQVIVTTKGGTNHLHGSAFWYYQSSDFDAIPYTYPTTTTKPEEIGNTFGGSVGGPVVIPHFYNGHDKSFFFVAYEGWRHPAQTVAFANVPSTLMKQGDFSRYNSASFNPTTGNLINPNTGQSLGTTIPSSMINPISANIMKDFFPDPNIGDPTIYNDNGVANWEKNVDDSGTSDQVDVRGDQYFGSNQKFLIWGRYTTKSFPTQEYSQYLLPDWIYDNQSHGLIIDTNWNITPTIINEGRFGYTKYSSNGNVNYNGLSWTQQQGFIGLQDLWFNGLPAINFAHLSGLTADRLNLPSWNNLYDYSDTLIWNKGHHTMKFGGDVQQWEAYFTTSYGGGNNYGTWSFNGVNSQGLVNPIDFADFLFGVPYSSFYGTLKYNHDGVSGHQFYFAQDEWHVNNRLTLSYGVRYEYEPGFWDKAGAISLFDEHVPLSGRLIYPKGFQANAISAGFLASANACDPDGVHSTNSAVINGAPCMPVLNNVQAGVPKGLVKTDKFRFMPRFGFAYRLTDDDKWAIRGGFGMYTINMGYGAMYSITDTSNGTSASYQNTYNAATHTLGFQWPEIYAGANGSDCSNCYGHDYFGTDNEIDWKDPYVEQWGLSVDHDFGKGYAGRVSYIGSEAHQLIRAVDYNTMQYSSTISAYNQPFSARPFPNWGLISTRYPGADESYHSLQVEANHRLQNGLDFNSMFTWAKALADNNGPAPTTFAGETGQTSTSILTARVDFGNVYGTRRLRWNTTALYDLPFGRGKQFGGDMPRALDLIAGGWRLTSIFTVQTGPWESAYFPGGQMDPSGTGSGLSTSLAGFGMRGADQHADDVAGEAKRTRGHNRMDWVNSKAYTCPADPAWTVGTPCLTGAGFNADGTPHEGSPHPLPIGRFGNDQVGSVEGPGLVNLSAGLSKSFTVVEGLRIRLEGTFTNVLNHTNLGDPNMNLDSTTFGLISRTVSADFGGARTGQVAARIEF